jgi:hypothetical protein
MLTSMLLTTLLLAPNAPAADPCTLRPIHGTPLLLGDVVQQTIVLTPSGKCDALAKSGGAALLLANSSDSQYKAITTLTPPTGKDPGWTITLTTPVIAPRNQTDAVTSTWNLYATESAMTGGAMPIAQVFITPSVVTLRTTTAVVYDDPILSETANSDAKPADVAYTSEESLALKNIAHLDLAGVGSVKKWSTTSSNTTLVDVGGNNCAASPCVSIQTIAFRSEPSTTPLTAEAKADRGNGESFTITVRLAGSAQPSSIPLNIADIAYLTCQTDGRISRVDIVGHGKLAAVNDRTVTNGRCKLVIDEEDITWVIARQHKIPHKRVTCRRAQGLIASIEQKKITGSRYLLRPEPADSECTERRAARGASITVIAPHSGRDDGDQKHDPHVQMEALKKLYGIQRITVTVSTGKGIVSSQAFLVHAGLSGQREFALDFGADKPSQEHPYTIEVAVQPASDNGSPPTARGQHPERVYQSRLRPKGPFGITHRRNSLGSKSVRMFFTVPLDFTAIRFPAAGLDLKSSSDTNIAQISALTTGLLLSVEPWDYTHGVNWFGVPIRAQGGLLMSNWYKGVFHPSTYLGGAFILPVFRGPSQLDVDLALGIGWEVDLRSGYGTFAERNHLLVTIGMNIFSLLSPKSAPLSK